ncbi:MAG: hypothetical protein A2X49_07760 [Lentisphaerae bacterium GWF2_52_8]|nr:MAG: hypothetical protein A2X49_07760 [Lentisphaerae bacterium GWF2_52_8]
MKAMLFSSLVSCLMFAYGCGQEPPPASRAQAKPSYSNTQTSDEAKQTEGAPQAKASATAQSATSTQQAASPAKASSTSKSSSTTSSSGSEQGSLSSFANYATGQTPLTIKKIQSEKIQKIQDEHNKKLEKALNQ